MENQNFQKFLKEAKEKTEVIKVSFQNEIIKVRTSRPSPELVEDLKVDAYNSKMPLKHLASISVIPPNAIKIEVWDKTLIPAIKNAISHSQLGLTPQEDGNILKLYLPALSEERKKELALILSKMKEEARIKIRKFRDEILKEIKKSFEDKLLSEDEMFSLKEKIEKIIEETNKELDEIERKKIEEIEKS